MLLIIGSPNSGKSLYGENLAMSMFGGEKKAYIATMIPYGEDGQKRVERHRRLRSGKGFITIEKPDSVDELQDVFLEQDIENAMLECLSNLVGNEIYNKRNAGKSQDAIVELIVEEVLILDRVLKHLIVISNEFGILDEYDEETKKYIKITAEVNEILKKKAKRYIVKENGEWVDYENN